MAKVQLKGFTMNADVYPGLVPVDTVFLHGNLASNTWWGPALDIWKRDAKPGNEGRLIFVEWRGCGKTDAPETEADLSMEKMGADTVALLRELGVHKANLVGHSTGGLIGLYALLQAPELFDRAVMLDSVSATGVQFAPEMYDAFTQMSQNRDFCAAIMGATIHQNDASSALFQKIVDDSFGIAKLNWHGIPNALKSINLVDQLSKITQPILVLHGEHDNLLPKEGSIAMAKNLGMGTFYEIPGQGHCTNVENPMLFVKLINDFLYKLD